MTFSENVAVSGTPQLLLRIGDTLRDADYVSGSGTATLSFSYTVQADDADHDGISIDGFALKLNGGAITRHGDTGVNAVLTHTGLIDDAGQKVVYPAVTVSVGAPAYSVAEGSSATVTVTLSADPLRTVTIPITAGGASDADFSLSASEVTFESGETEQSITVTATDDTVADDGESVALGFGPLPAGVTAGSQATATVDLADDEVPANWSLLPSGLGAGAEFRLLFVVTTTGHESTSPDIADYNAFVQAAAGGGHTDVQSRSSAFRALGSTSAVDARDNTATTHTAADRGVPTSWLNGPKGADDYADFYDGSWDHRNPIRNEHGNARLLPSFFSIWTGSNSDGTRSSNNSYLGSTSPRVGRPGSGAGHEISSDRINPRSNVALYGLSGVFRVEGVAAVDNADLSDLRVDGTSVDGFAAATISYTAGVANPVERVAIAASTSDPGAGLA